MLFPRLLQHVSFWCSGGKEVEWKKKITPPPTVAAWLGRNAVGPEPAGRSRAYLWSAFSWLQSEALFSATGGDTSSPKRSGKKCTFSPRPLWPSLCPSHTLPPGLCRTQDEPVYRNEEQDLAASAEPFTTACHTGPNW